MESHTRPDFCPSTRTRALTAPVVQSPIEVEYNHSTTNHRPSFIRDRHAVPPSILAQNRELLGQAHPPPVACNEEHHTCTYTLDSDSSESSHIEYGEVTVMVPQPMPQPRRRSTLESLSKTVCETGKNAKRRISKVIPWRRKDSAKENEIASPPSKALRIDLGRGSQALESSAALLDDNQISPSQTSWHDALSPPSPYTLDHAQRTPPNEASQELLVLHRVSRNSEVPNATPRALMQESVEFSNQYWAAGSPEWQPHQCFMENPELWEQSAKRLDYIARSPQAVAARFDRIYEAMNDGDGRDLERLGQESIASHSEDPSGN